MKLFKGELDLSINLLPFEGVVNYYGKIINEDANIYLNRLLKEIKWTNDIAIIFGKKILTKRKVAWYGDESYSYTYSKLQKLLFLGPKPY